MGGTYNRHTILLDKALTLYQSSSWGMRLVRELLEIRVTEEVINRERGFRLIGACVPMIEQTTVAAAAEKED